MSWFTTAMVLCANGQERYFDPRLINLIMDGNYREVFNILEPYKVYRTKNSFELHQLTDSHQATLLHYAADYGDGPIVQYLLDSNFNVDAKNYWGRTPLMLAVLKKHEVVFEILIKANANIHLTDFEGKSALQMLLDFQKIPCSMFRNLLQYKSWQNILQGTTPDELANKLHEGGFTLRASLEWGSADLMKLLLRVKNVNQVCDRFNGQTLLHIAIKTKAINMAKILIDCGASVNALDSGDATPLCYLYGEGDKNESVEVLDMLKIFVSRATSLTARKVSGEMQIFNVLVYGNDESVKIVLQSNINLLATDVQGNTVLHYLAENRNIRHVDLFKLMEGKILDVNACNIYGRTPLHLAAEWKLSPVLIFLLENGADANAMSNFGETPLYQAFACNNEQFVEILLDFGADPQKCIRGSSQISEELSQISEELTRAKPILAHLAIVQELGTKITDLTRRKIIKSSWKKYFDMCVRQVKRMKKTMIYGDVTLLDFLTESHKKVTAHVCNEELVDELEKIIEKFEVGSLYPEILRRRLARAIQLAELKAKTIDNICRLINPENIVPYCIAEKVFEYLSNRDIKNLDLVCKE